MRFALVGEINAWMKWWLVEELNVKWKGIDPFLVRKWMKSKWNGLGKKELKSAPDV